MFEAVKEFMGGIGGGLDDEECIEVFGYLKVSRLVDVSGLLAAAEFVEEGFRKDGVEEFLGSSRLERKIAFVEEEEGGAALDGGGLADEVGAGVGREGELRRWCGVAIGCFA